MPSPFRSLSVLFASSAVAFATAAPVLLQATEPGPWGYGYNKSAFASIYGASGYTFGLYTNVTAASVFSAANPYVCLEGSQSDAEGFKSFYDANHALIQSWVGGGGSLVVTFSPQSNLNFDPGFGITASPFYVDVLNAVGTSPVSAGPYGGATTMRGYFGATVEFTGTGLTTLFSGAGGKFMVERAYGRGHVVFSSLTTSFYGNFTGTENEKFNAVGKNLVAYGQAQAVPEPAALLPLGLAAFALRRRRRTR